MVLNKFSFVRTIVVVLIFESVCLAILLGGLYFYGFPVSLVFVATFLFLNYFGWYSYFQYEYEVRFDSNSINLNSYGNLLFGRRINKKILKEEIVTVKSISADGRTILLTLLDGEVVRMDLPISSKEFDLLLEKLQDMTQ